MRINEDYKKIECIKKLEKHYRDSFFKIVEDYASKLEEKININGNVYTLHDFNHHCINIYKIISDIILYSPEALGSNGLSQMELYILNLAVLFHDMGMQVFVDSKRDSHSRRSLEYIEEIYNTPGSAFRANCNLNENEITALKLIVMAHSDIKGENVPDSQNGLNNPSLDDEMPSQTGSIRARFLASVLRLADELDITVARLGNGDLESQLNKFREEKLKLERELSSIDNYELSNSIQNKLEEIKGYVNSLEHWKRLHLFKYMKRRMEDNEIYIYVNDDYIKRAIDRGDSCENIAEAIVYVYNKINKELQNGLLAKIHESAKKRSLQALISIAKFKLISDNDELNTYIAEKLGYVKINQKGVEHEVASKLDSELSEKESLPLQPEVIDKKIEEKLGKIIAKKGLLKVGHFLLDETYCARDWLDTKEIIETRVTFEDIIKCIIAHINQHYGDSKNYLLLGLDLEGAILASRIAMSLQRPFSYLIPAKDLDNNTGKDIETAIEKFDKYIIITDAIVTGETIRKVLNTLSIEDDYEKVLQIYTIFYRTPSSICTERNEMLIRKTTCVSAQFGVELFKKEDCPYKPEKCFGMNRIIK